MDRPLSFHILVIPERLSFMDGVDQAYEDFVSMAPTMIGLGSIITGQVKEK